MPTSRDVGRSPWQRQEPHFSLLMLGQIQTKEVDKANIHLTPRIIITTNK